MGLVGVNELLVKTGTLTTLEHAYYMMVMKLM